MRTEVLQRLINEYLNSNPVDDLAVHITDILEQEERLRQRVSELHAEEMAETQRRKKFIEDRDRRLAEIQSECPHYDFTFSGDPSGGNDSFHECNLCKKMM
jgi:hypothetical protein